MERIHLVHLVRVTSALLSSAQVIITGLAGMYSQLRSPSPRLDHEMDKLDCIEVLVSDGYDCSDSLDLLRETIGRGSHFHEKFGYFVRPTKSQDVNLPDDWLIRLERLNSVRGGPHLLSISANDFVLGSFYDSVPDSMLNLELLVSEYAKVYQMRDLLMRWSISPDDRLRVQTGLAKLEHIRSNVLDPESITAKRAPGPAWRRVEPDDPVPNNIIPIVGRRPERRIDDDIAWPPSPCGATINY